MKSYAVIGLGRFGEGIAKKLYEYGEDVLAIDTSEELVNGIADRVTRAAVADAREPAVLKGLGVQDCDCAVVAVGTDLASSVLITMNLKNLGVQKIVCKAHDDTHRAILEKLGADQVIIPERVVADKTARELAAPNILEYIELSSECGISEYPSPKAWSGKTLRELNIRAKYGLNVIAVKDGEKIKVSPSADFRLTEGSFLMLLGEYTAMERFRESV